MKVTREDAIGIFQSLGYIKLPLKWNDSKLANKLNRLAELLHDVNDLPITIVRDWERIEPQLLINQVRKAVEAGERIKIIPACIPGNSTQSTATGENDMKHKAKKEKKGNAVPKEKEKTAKTVAKAQSKKDAFGSREDSKFARVNAMLTKKPLKMKAVKEKMGNTYYNHLNKLVKKGLVVKSEDGYSLP